MGLFSVADLTELRSLTAELKFHDECRIRAARDEADGFGGYTQSWSDSANFPCNVITGNNATQAGNQGLVPILGEETAVTIELPFAEAVDSAGQAIVTAADRIVSDNRLFEIVHIAPPGGLDMLVTAYCVDRGVDDGA